MCLGKFITAHFEHKFTIYLFNPNYFYLSINIDLSL